MSLLKQINDKGAVLEWCPIASQSNLVALGTKDSAGIGFDDYGGDLEIHMLDFKNSKSKSSSLLGKTKASSRFSSIAWSQMANSADSYPFGLIAGGMVDGIINIWDPAKLSSGDEDPLIVSVEQHTGGIRGLQFNPHRESSHLLATGGSDGEVYVMSLEQPDNPNVFIPAPSPNNSKHTAEVTKVAWNTQVPHIMSSAAMNGSCYVWDLRQKKAWCELRDPAGGAVADIAWKPDQGLHIITASGDDKNPVLKLWDLRSSTSMPLTTLQGHTEGILSVSWCPNDSSLVMSCGKDNRTYLWDLFHLKPVYSLPSTSEASDDETNSSSMYGGFGSAAVGQRRYHVSWSPCVPAVVSTCSFDRKVEFFSVSGVKTQFGRAPKWLRRPAGAAFGFGGKLVTFGNQKSPGAGSDPKKPSQNPRATVSQVVEDPALISACDQFHQVIASGEFREYCHQKSMVSDITVQEQEEWQVLRIMGFETQARVELLKHLGFEAQRIENAVNGFLHGSNPDVVSDPSSSLASMTMNSPFDMSSYNAEDVFGAEQPTALASPPRAAPTSVTPSSTSWTESITVDANTETLIRQAVVVGNFAAAVDCCLQAGLFAEALVLSQCGDRALIQRTEEAFFNHQMKKRGFLPILFSVIHHDFENYIRQSSLDQWRETLAVICTYVAEDFPRHCEILANRLEQERSDYANAMLCYLCASNVPKVVQYWVGELNKANEAVGKLDTPSLQLFVEKVLVLTAAHPTQDLSDEAIRYFSKYAALLASQGRLDYAAKYVKDGSFEEKVLIDRLYHSGSKPPGSKSPPFPFERVTISSASSSPNSTGASSVAVNSTNNNPAVNNNNNNKTATVGNSKPVMKNAMPSQTQAQTLPSFPGMNRQDGMGQVGVAAGFGSNMHNNAASAAMTATSNPNPISMAPMAPMMEPVAPQLPTGWMQLIDPSSQRPYYVNQATGVSQWEPPFVPEPLPVPVPAPVPVVTASVSAGNPMSNNMMMNSINPVTNNMMMNPVNPMINPNVSSHNGLAGRSVSVHEPVVAAMPSVIASTPASNVANSTSEHSPSDAVSGEFSVTVQQLEALINSVAGVDRRQHTMVLQCFNLFKEKLNRNEVSSEVLAKTQQLVVELQARNFFNANAIQTDLANSVWDLHKEWLKGMKILILLLSKLR